MRVYMPTYVWVDALYTVRGHEHGVIHHVDLARDVMRFLLLQGRGRLRLGRGCGGLL